ncbi:hypothetical protein WMF31_31280 [Sorangium sp. So ce1036]|uniref:hypothetical protein n=1 Tax=Sorangium sp. So ce1036 TaxID=3133328 RepID=UPI003F0ECFA9
MRIVIVYAAMLLLGVAAVAVSVSHYVVVAWRNREADARALAGALEARRDGGVAPLPDRSRGLDLGLLLSAFGFAFACDALASAVGGAFTLRGAGGRAVAAAFVAVGAHYVLARVGRVQRRPAWSRSPWLCWLVAVALGLLGGAAAVTSPPMIAAE